MKWPKVSVITINYNSIEATLDFLESIFKISYPNFEVILIDNKSDEFNVEVVRELYPHVRVICNNENYGFAKGNNIGLHYAKGEYYAFLNNDTIVDKNFLEPIIKILESDSKIAIASPKVLYLSDKKIQFAGASDLGYFTGRGKVVGRGEVDEGQYDNCCETSIIHGGAMIIAKKVVEHIGEIPEDYFLYYEELDWGKRALKMGYKLMYVGTSKIFDKVSQSIGPNSPLKTYYLNRSRLIYTRLNSMGFQKILWLTIYFGLAVPRDIIRFLLHKKNDHIRAIFKAINWNIKSDAKSISRN